MIVHANTPPPSLLPSSPPPPLPPPTSPPLLLPPSPPPSSPPSLPPSLHDSCMMQGAAAGETLHFVTGHDQSTALPTSNPLLTLQINGQSGQANHAASITNRTVGRFRASDGTLVPFEPSDLYSVDLLNNLKEHTIAANSNQKRRSVYFCPRVIQERFCPFRRGRAFVC